MKTLVRAFALSLVAVGAFASTHIVRNADITVASAQMNAMPVPVCPPSDPNGCHIGDSGK